MSRWTLYRYFFRRWAWPLFGAVLFFGGMMFAFELRGITKLISEIPGASLRWVGPYLLTTMPETLFIILPMAALLGSVMGTQQLSESSEWVASQGLGAGPRVILAPWAILGAFLVVVASLNAHVLVPKMAQVQTEMKATIADEGMRRALKPGAKPYTPAQQPGTSIWMSGEGQIHLMSVDNEQVQHLVAKSLAWQQTRSNVDNIVLTFNDLSGTSVRKDTGAVLQTQARQQQILVALDAGPKIFTQLDERYAPTRSLLATLDRKAWVELSRRICLPLSVAGFLLLGLGMAIAHPRFYKGGALVKSLGVLIIYYALVKVVENRYLAERWHHAWTLFLLPLLLFGLGALLVWTRLRPHHSNRQAALAARLAGKLTHTRLVALCRALGGKCQDMGFTTWRRVRASAHQVTPRLHRKRGIFRSWSTRAWLTRWLGTLMVFLALSLFIEYSNLAGDLSQSGNGLGVFFQYWLWNLPPFLLLILPMVFLFAGVLFCSDASASHEWVAVKSGGIGILKWLWASKAAWLSVLVMTAIVQIWVAPVASQRADILYHRILKRPAPVFKDTKPWLHLSATGIHWFTDGDQRWGFPLRPMEEAPVLVHYRLGAPSAEVLPWKATAFSPGPAAGELFPDPSLQRFAKPEHVPTQDLFHWQHWAPSPAQATMLWGRILGWLAGPCLFFAVLAHAFPSPRQGRGKALGYALVVGLAYTGLQMILGDAARLGELPVLWGILAPMLAAVSFGLSQLPRLRT